MNENLHPDRVERVDSHVPQQRRSGKARLSSPMRAEIDDNKFIPTRGTAEAQSARARGRQVEQDD